MWATPARRNMLPATVTGRLLHWPGKSRVGVMRRSAVSCGRQVPRRGYWTALPQVPDGGAVWCGHAESATERGGGIA